MEKINKIIQNEIEYDIQDKPLTNEVEILKVKTKDIEASIKDFYKKPTEGIGKTDLSEVIKESLNKADSAIQDVSGKLDITRAEELYQPKGEYLKSENLIGYATEEYVNEKRPTKLSELENDSGFLVENDLENEIYYIHFNIANAKACEDAYKTDPTADLSGYEIFTENEADIITKLKENSNLHAILIDEDGNHYQLCSTETTKKGKFKVKFTAPTSSKKMIKVEFSTAANDFTSFDKTAIDIGDNELLSIKYLYNYNVDDANKVYKNTDPVIYPSQYIYRKDEIDSKGFLTQHQKLKTINGNSLIGEGDIKIVTEGTSGAPIDDENIGTTSTYSSQKINNTYIEKNDISNLINNDAALTEKLNAKLDSAVATQTYQAKGDYALASAIPTTLPASDVKKWAKADTKPKYTAEEVGAYSKDQIDQKGFLVASDISGKLDATDAKTLYQPKGTYLTENSLTGYATQTWVEDKNYLTEHQSLTDYAKTTDVDEKINKKLDIITANTKYALKTDLDKYVTNDEIDNSSIVKKDNKFQLKQEYIDFLENQLYKEPSIAAFKIYYGDSNTDLSRENEAGTKLTAKGFYHKETNIANINGNVSVLKDSVAVVSKAGNSNGEYSDFATTYDINTNTTFRLQIVDKKGKTIYSDYKINFYRYDYVILSDSDTAPTEAISGSRQNTGFATSGNEFTYNAGQHIYFYTQGENKKVETEAVGQWATVDTAEYVGIVSFKQLNGTVFNYNVYRTPAFIKDGKAKYRIKN